jgi:hypothetical protein
MCKALGAALMVGKIDRLSRDVRFFLEVIDDSGVDIRFADLPDVCPGSDEGRMILVSMANFAEFEGRRIGTRTRAALAAAKARGVQLGTAGPRNLKPNIEARQAQADAFAAKLSGFVAGCRARSLSQRAMVAELNQAGVPSAQGGRWGLAQVQRLLHRIDQQAWHGTPAVAAPQFGRQRPSTLAPPIENDRGRTPWCCVFWAFFLERAYTSLPEEKTQPKSCGWQAV